MTQPRPPEEAPVLRLDRNNQDAWNFRSTADGSGLPEGLNTLGLDQLRMSGSASLSSREQVGHLSRLWGPSFHVIDLREEPHAIVDNHAVGWIAGKNWANLGKSRADALDHEQRLIEELRGQTPTVHSAKDIKKKRPDPLKVTLDGHQAIDEASFVKAAGGQYTRLMVSDHLRPRDEDVDQFVAMARGLAEDTAVHFHCKGGRGRTTTFMIMFDMLRNARAVSADEILARQAALEGRVDLAKTRGQVNPKQAQVERLAFLEEFHAYAKANPEGRPRTWSEWLG